MPLHKNTKPRIYKWLGYWYCSSEVNSDYNAITISQVPFGAKTPQEAYMLWYNDTYYPKRVGILKKIFGWIF